ncbi:disintegrin and metalloproteinase domain-containing protein 28 [Trichonephila clavata]|uniref:Disintegrin and metalloproteinase domain-containing protein 28 n=1 Tax=Trichonephila clavata TaxID=2740835 RepID=A0A8X6J8E1_TRICU|nr:disintegrin and metalloproteinase domain-containing protein 28 [Trichonephila clavata]
MDQLKPVATASHGSKKVFVHPALKTCSHVFVRHDAVKKPLQTPYDGPYLICTNINTCNCEEGWKGHDCSIIDEDNQLGSAKKDADYYDSMGESLLESSQYENELRLNPNLAVTVLAGCIFIGLVLVVIAVLFIFNRNLWITKSSSH